MEDKHDAFLLVVGSYGEKLGDFVDGKGTGISTLKAQYNIATEKYDVQEVFTLPLDTKENVASPINSSYLAFHPKKKNLFYAADEAISRDGYVRAYNVDNLDGHVSYIDSKVSNLGTLNCHVLVTESGKNLLYANYMGSFGIVSLDSEGKLSTTSRKHFEIEMSSLTYPLVNADRQEGPHAHMIYQVNNFVFVMDLGSNCIHQLILDEDNANYDENILNYNSTKPQFVFKEQGFGPRHCLRHPSLPLLYVVSELTSTIKILKIDLEKGTLSEFDDDDERNSCISTFDIDHPNTLTSDCTSVTAAIHLHPSGKFLYCSNRLFDKEGSLAVFRVHPDNGSLRLTDVMSSGGSFPRDFCISDDGFRMIIANQNDDTLLIGSINQETGSIEEKSKVILKDISFTPICIKYLPLKL